MNVGQQKTPETGKQQSKTKYGIQTHKIKTKHHTQVKKHKTKTKKQ